ncbi:MAG TPA: hypothetical protein VF698_10515 [Thermoanaerobaculia bacterium]|jgi:hypothetical protein
MRAMQQVNPDAARWLAFGCAAVFAAPFVLFGLGFFVMGVTSRQPAAMLFGAVFSLVGVMAVLAVWYSTKKMRETLVLRAKYATTPWLWREDWAAGRADETKNASVALLAFSLFWLAFCAPFVYFVTRQPPAETFVWIFIGIFPLVGLLMLFGAVYQLLRRRKYGLSVCRLNQVPIEPGTALRGEIHARVSDIPTDGFKLHLKCVRRITTSSGKSSTTREELQWDEQRTIPPHAIPRGFDGMRLPFTFNIPASAPPTDIHNPRDAMVWRLEVKAEVPGVDYAANFDVPVFRKPAP